jgi:hypothetical protein
MSTYPTDLYSGCPCYRCESPNWREIIPGVPAARMCLCPQCGNKRCPAAADHDNPCSGSNEPGQPGSLYADPIPARPEHEESDHA